MTLFIVFLFLAIYNAGCMTTLQLQHYGIYPAVPRQGFAEHIRANNRAAGEMGVTGYDERKISLLIRTNWIRTICYWLLAALAISIVVRLVPRGVAIPS